MNSEIRIRQNASSNDLKLLLEIIAEEGWSTSHVDLNASLEVDASGLLIAEDLSGVLGMYTIAVCDFILDMFLTCQTSP